LLVESGRFAASRLFLCHIFDSRRKRKLV
jgi:hypothetical protein